MSVGHPQTPAMAAALTGPFRRRYRPIKLITRSPRGSPSVVACIRTISGSVPAQRPSRLVLDDSRLEEILFLLEIDHLGHPGEGVGRAGKQRVQSDLLTAPVGDVTQVL